MVGPERRAQEPYVPRLAGSDVEVGCVGDGIVFNRQAQGPRPPRRAPLAVALPMRVRPGRGNARRRPAPLRAAEQEEPADEEPA